MAQISTRKRGSTWEYSFEIASVDGKRKRKSKGGFRTKKLALEAGTQAKAEYDQCGKVIDAPTLSLSDWLDSWYEDTVEKRFKESTKETYISAIRKIKSEIGHYKLGYLSPLVLNKWFNKLIDEDGYKTSYVRNIRRILNSAYNYACSMEVIKNNPCGNVKIRSSEEEKYSLPKIITPEEFNLIMDNIHPHYLYYRIPFLIGWYTGMRSGEILALTWGDIDFENKIIKVTKTITEANGQSYVTTPKTPNALREIMFGDKLSMILQKWQETQILNATKLSVEPPQEVCTRNSLVPIKGSNLRQQCITLSDRLGIDFHFHMLRHTHATLLIKNNVSIKEVQARLGHKSIQTTLDIYTHVKGSDCAKSVDIFEQFNVGNSLTNHK